MAPGPLQMPHSSYAPRSRLHCRRCHRRRRRCAVTTAHAQGVELVAVAVAISFWDVRTSALVDGARTVADAALVVCAYAVVDVITDAIGIGVRCAVTAHSPSASSWLPSQSQSPSDVRTSALVDGARSVADAALVVRTHAVVRRRRCHRHPHPPHTPLHIHQARRAGCRRSRNHLRGCQNIRTRRWLQGRCRCRTRRTHPRSRQRRHRCHRHRRPRAVTTAHAHKASRWLPSQSQSPSGMSEHPHS